MFNKTLVRYFNTASNSKSFGHKSTKSTFYVRFVFHIAVLFYVHSAVRKIGARAERSDSEQSLIARKSALEKTQLSDVLITDYLF